MGGIGSGRKSQGGKATTRDYLALDIRTWHRQGLLVAGEKFNLYWYSNKERVASIHVQIGGGYARLIYRRRNPMNKSQWNDLDYSVLLAETQCNFGGSRAWFVCPTAECGRRVALLYLDGSFACRHCLRLAYDSQREVAADRAIRIACRLRKRLGWNESILDFPGHKPKGMHQRTFEKLLAKHQALLDILEEHSMKKFGIGVM